jgi:DNA-binding NtrC family response regulator
MMSGRRRVLIIDDEANFREFLGEAIQAEGYEVSLAPTARSGIQRAREQAPHVIVLDQNLPDESGLAVLHQLRALPFAPRVIMMTAFAEYPRAVEAVKKGAFHYLQKPFEFHELLRLLDDATSAPDADGSLDANPAVAAIVGVSEDIRDLKRQIAQIARSPVASVLIQGESGTGKELVARAIHALSTRSSERLVSVNCAALSDSLLVSELFGHEKGAFTDAREQRKGVFESAHGGSLFLDEISEMGPRTQAAVLRALEQRAITRVGGTAEIAVDVRIIAASNTPLEKMVSASHFRTDLYYRLNVVKLEIPSLRSRPADIPSLADYFSRQIAARYGEAARPIPPDVMTRLQSYSWPGNVRELKNAIERTYVMDMRSEISLDSLPPEISGVVAGAAMGLDASLRGMTYPEAKRRLIEQFERTYLKQLLNDADGNVSRAARAAGIHRQAFQRLLSRYDITRT